MSRRPFDPGELDGRRIRDSVVPDLERYADLASREMPSSDFADRVSSAIEAEPAPRRGPLAWLIAPQASGDRFTRLARATVLSAALALAVAAVLLAGQLASIVRDLQVGTSPSPSVIESNLPSPSASPASPSAAPSVPASSSPEESGSPAQSDVPNASEDGEESGTPRPTATETPSPTPTDSPTPEASSSGHSSDG